MIIIAPGIGAPFFRPVPQPPSRPVRTTAAQLLYDWNPVTNSIHFDGAIEEMLGYPAAGFGPNLAQWEALIHPDDRAAFDAEIARVLKDGAVFLLTYRVRKADGTYLPIEDVGQFVRDREGKVERMVGFVTDVTARWADRLEVERLANFARFNPNPVLELSAAGEINFANDAAYQTMRALGRDSLRAILPANTDPLLRQCLKLRAPALRIEVEVADRIISWSFFPIPNRELVHCYGGDITERKRLEEQVRHAQKMEAVGQLSGGIAHDFNNLLTVIQSHVGLMEMSPTIAPELTRSLAGIRAAADRASNLTRQLLTFSRKQPMQMQVIDLRQVVVDMTKLLTRLLGEPIQVKFALSDEPQLVKADTNMMEQIIMNLAVNARDAMPAGGQLNIAVETVEDVDPATGVTETCVRLTVRDTGVGIAPDILPRIFDPFFTTKEVGKGTGLGLATVYSIVEQHAGHLEVTSEVGAGTTFTIYLPRSQKPADTALPPGAIPVPDQGSETILVVEDELMVRVLVEQILARAGYVVLTAEDAAGALRVWEKYQEQITLLLTDLVMPGAMGGWALAERLKASRPALRVIYMTGYNRDVAGENPLLREGLNFLSKPFRPDRLLSVVRACLDHKESRTPFPDR